MDENGQHAYDFDGIGGELFVKKRWKELKIFREEQMVLQFAGGTACDGAETGEVTQRISAGSFRAHGDLVFFGKRNLSTKVATPPLKSATWNLFTGWRIADRTRPGENPDSGVAPSRGYHDRQRI